MRFTREIDEKFNTFLQKRGYWRYYLHDLLTTATTKTVCAARVQRWLRTILPHVDTEKHMTMTTKEVSVGMLLFSKGRLFLLLCLLI